MAAAVARFLQHTGWKNFGFARLSDHARERWGRSSRWAQHQSALDRAIKELPPLATAITGDDGGEPLDPAAARQIGRVADIDSVQSWIYLARTRSCRELEAQVSGTLGEAPDFRPPACRLTLMVPALVRQAFTETHELHKCVEGYACSAEQFIESLVAEACSGSLSEVAETLEIPVLREHSSLEFSLPEPSLPESSSRATSFPESPSPKSSLPESSSPEPSLPESSLDREPAPDRTGHAAWSDLELVSSQQRTAIVQGADADVRRLLRLQGKLERRLAGVLCALADAADWQQLGFRNIGDYAERVLGWGRSTLYSRIRLGRLLRRLPIVQAAYEEGRLGMSSAQALATFLLRESPDGTAPFGVPFDVQQAWVEHAESVTVKRLDDEIRIAGRLQLITREAGAGTRANGTDAHQDASRRPPWPLDDEAWHLGLRRDVGSARKMIEKVQAMAQSEPGALVPLRLSLEFETAAAFREALDAARRLPAVVQMFSPATEAAPEWAGLLALLGEFIATWDVDLAGRRPSAQRIYSRDGWRCMAPGCSSRRNLETHHVMYRSRGGGDGSENLICLCRFHHQMGEHGGLARVRGKAPLGLVWRLGMNGCGGRFTNERRLHSSIRRRSRP